MGNCNKKVRKRLFRENPHCHWCGVETLLVGNGHIKRANPRMATVDHLYSRYDLRRYVKGEQKRVLACFRCNNSRSAQETKRLTREEIAKRSKGYTFDVFKKPVESLEEVVDILKERGILTP